MSCHGCATKYTIFNKENGCPNCGFSFCKKCLKFKAVIPKLGNSEQLVCKACHLALTDLGGKRGQQEHPAAFLQRLESLENPSRPPITVYQHDQRMEQLKTGLTQTDKDLAERLEKLREDRKRERLPSEDEIAQRLALLKGEDPERMPSVHSKNMVTNLCSQQQQADDLIQQLQEEHQLGLKHPSPEEDIASRLAKLRGLEGTSPVTKTAIEPTLGVGSKSNDVASTSLESMSLDEANALLAQLRDEEKCNVGEKELETSAERCLKEMRSNLMKKGHKKSREVPDDIGSESDCDEEATQQVIQKVLEESALEEKLELSDCSEGSSSDEEQPWCVICDENATLKCPNCSGDLYCNSCFKHGHKDLDMKDHKPVPFNPTKK